MRVLPIWVSICAGLLGVVGCGNSTDTSTNTSANTTVVDLAPAYESFEIIPGQNRELRFQLDEELPADAQVELRFLARTHISRFIAGSYVFLQVEMNDAPLVGDQLIKPAPCYYYPQCEWPEDCAEHCHEWFFPSFTSQLSCEGIDFISPEPRENIFALQMSNNFENNMLRDDPTKPGENDNLFFIDPEQAGNPYEFRFDVSDLLRNSQGEITLRFVNPMTEYRDFMGCIIRRDDFYWQNDDLQYVKIVVDEISLKASVTL